MAFNGDTRERDRSIGLQLNIRCSKASNAPTRSATPSARREASEAELAEQQVSLEVWSNYQSLSVETRSLARTRELVEQSRQSLEVVQGRYRSGSAA